MIIELEHKVRACYHKYLGIEAETLAWIMAIDGLFLLEFLHSFYIDMKENMSSSTSTTAHLMDSAGRKLAHNGILGDIMMLENQIPIFLLSKILSIQCSLPDVEDNLLPSMLVDFCKALSPLKLIMEDLPLSQVSEHAHLLDLLYHMTVPKIEGPHDPPSNNTYGNMGSSSFGTSSSPRLDSSKSGQVFDKLWNLLTNLNVGTGGIGTIKFDNKTMKFYLPVITLNVNSEVVMRNLVAYEASTTSESLVFARYTELMNGIIDTDEDAKLLREKKIIVNSLKSDADVAELFNGMSKAVRLTKVPHIDKAIEDVNIYFNNSQKIRMYRRMKNFVYGSWQILTIIAVILLMFLMAIQSFCSVYSCPRIFHTMSSSTSG
ncbi:putative UPF0481 protein [Camellia lanceoleosa]|uniref:UPF0481 protein n=1 Tax=Camellia lanceoleosa TaxID=1840588 RepID=A0ACC0I9W0_9ERIC|nr:putative UPF0481 protein [Camellia lanceoleosa]